MFALWLILGAVMILMGIFNRQMLRLLGFRPASDIMISPNLKRSSKIVEQIGRWLQAEQTHGVVVHLRMRFGKVDLVAVILKAAVEARREPFCGREIRGSGAAIRLRRRG